MWSRGRNECQALASFMNTLILSWLMLSWWFLELLGLSVIFRISRRSRSIIYRCHNHILFGILSLSRQSRFSNYLIRRAVNILRFIFTITSCTLNPWVSAISMGVAFTSVVTAYWDFIIFVYIVTEALTIKTAPYYILLRKKHFNIGIFSSYR